jgi:manganese/zinc/iron transport system permease protein
MMTVSQIEIQLIAAVVAVACALPGVFLILRRMAMMSDAISHTVLLGIVLAFFYTRDITSPLLIIGATLMGVATVSLVELVNRTGLVREDAAIGLVFPALFSLAVILISRFAGEVHLDTDAVLLGELAFAPFNRLVVLNKDLGPIALYVMGGIALLNLSFILLFYKELKLATFDAGLAATLGFTPGLLHYGLMSLVSITAVGAFDAVGSILVVAFMIAPPATAYLIVDRLSHLIGLSALVGVVSAVGGYWVSHALNVSIAGSMASMTGVLFFLAMLFAPRRGLIAIARRRANQKWTFAQAMLTIHLWNHEGEPDESEANRFGHLHAHLRWSPRFARQVVTRAVNQELIHQQNGNLLLTEKGRQTAREMMTNE